VAFENFCAISCPPSVFSDCEVEACLHGSTAVDNSEMPEQVTKKIRYELCEVPMEVLVDPAPEVESEPEASERVRADMGVYKRWDLVSAHKMRIS
jgi:hypothetical protein